MIMTEGINSYISLFVDDAKFMKIIKMGNNQKALQDLNHIEKWELQMGN